MNKLEELLEITKLISGKDDFDLIDVHLGQTTCSKCLNKNCDNCNISKAMKSIESVIDPLIAIKEKFAFPSYEEMFEYLNEIVEEDFNNGV